MKYLLSLQKIFSEAMKKIILFVALCCCIMMWTSLITACGNRKPLPPKTKVTADVNQSGDSTLYGLACDGCTDSVLVFLKNNGDNLDTFNIVNAVEEHRIYGRPHIGDELAVILNPERTTEVKMVINLSQLKGQWCYMVTPTLRHKLPRTLPDSVVKRIMAPREYGIRLKNGGAAFSIGAYRQATTDDLSPVEYPELKRYTRWQLHNGLLILTADTMKDQKPDTTVIEMLHPDSLVLRFSDHEQGYFKKQ